MLLFEHVSLFLIVQAILPQYSKRSLRNELRSSILILCFIKVRICLCFINSCWENIEIKHLCFFWITGRAITLTLKSKEIGVFAFQCAIPTIFKISSIECFIPVEQCSHNFVYYSLAISKTSKFIRFRNSLYDEWN